MTHFFAMNIALQAVYYGCAETVTGLAIEYIPKIEEYTKSDSIL